MHLCDILPHQMATMMPLSPLSTRNGKLSRPSGTQHRDDLLKQKTAHTVSQHSHSRSLPCRWHSLGGDTHALGEGDCTALLRGRANGAPARSTLYGQALEHYVAKKEEQKTVQLGWREDK